MFVVSQPDTFDAKTSPQYTHMKLSILDKMFHKARKEYEDEHGRPLPNGVAPPGFRVLIEWQPDPPQVDKLIHNAEKIQGLTNESSIHI